MQNVSVLRAAMIGVCVVALSACATVTRGTKQQFYVSSLPSGAKVSMTNGQICTTPCKIKLKRKHEFDTTVALAGYKSLTAHISSDVHGGGVAGAAGNILIGGLIGGVVDATNGSLNDLRPNPLHVVFAVSSMIMLATLIGMMADDFYRGWKVEQRLFRDVEEQIAIRSVLSAAPTDKK